jgi:hypothetical protein
MPAARSIYRVGQFAKLAGVTVRALHHYDRLGLLRPKRGAGGYRVYSERDLELLEQLSCSSSWEFHSGKLQGWFVAARDRWRQVSGLSVERWKGSGSSLTERLLPSKTWKRWLQPAS